MICPAVDVPRIPDDQRAALAWRLRTMLAEADGCAAIWRLSPHPTFAELARMENLRGSLLDLVSELEGARRLHLELVSGGPGPAEAQLMGARTPFRAAVERTTCVGVGGGL